MTLDIVNLTDRYKSHLYEVYLDPIGWRNFSTPYTLNWQKVRFSEANKISVPKSRGIYAFTVEHAPSKFPGHAYILYAGITGDTSAANLRSRYAQYLRHQKTQKGRPAVIYMLLKWPQDLFFSFCPLPDVTIDLAKLETDLLGALNPPINKKDFPAEIAAARKAKF